MKIRHHLCNENTFHNKAIGSAFWAARYWLHFNNNRTFNVEWYLGKRATSGFRCKIEWGGGDGDDGLMFHAAIPYIFSVYISMDGVFGKLFRHPNETRETGISFHDGGIYLYPFSKTNSWTKKDSWISKYHSFYPWEFICGKWKYTEEHVSSWESILVTMPEGQYKGKLRMFDGIWTNRFTTKRIRRGEIDMEEGIPFPGKGENSWDCGEDASYGITCPAKYPEEAICSMIQHVMRNRRCYGGYGSMLKYKPEQKHVRNSQNTIDNGDETNNMKAC